MLHCLNTSGNLTGNCSDVTFLERQRAARMMKSQQDHQQLQPQQHQHQQSYFFAASGFNEAFSSRITSDSFLAELVPHSMKPDQVLEHGWPELSKFDMFTMEFESSGLDVNSAISTPSSCPSSATAAAAAAVAVADSNGRGSVMSSEKLSSVSGRQSFKKRKADKAQNSKVVAENENKDKRIKVCAEEAGESKITEQTSTKSNTTTSNKKKGETSADNSKASEVPKPDYIHVRARRGQATDSHSLAERVRREKISERMKYLQDLVPGCNKITGKAGMLDEIINYVQSLQKQVEFLSMKLAAVNPSLDINIDDLFSKEMCPPFAPGFPSIGMSTDMTNTAYLQFNSAQQMASCSRLDMGINPSDVGLRRSIRDPVPMPEMFIDSPCFAQILPSTAWEADLQNLYNVGLDRARSTSSFPSQPFTGAIEASNLKMEM